MITCQPRVSIEARMNVALLETTSTCHVVIIMPVQEGTTTTALELEGLASGPINN